MGPPARGERSAHIFVIRVERATLKNSQLAPAQRGAMKMGRRLRCSSVTYPFRYAPSSCLADGPFLSQQKACYFGDKTLKGRIGNRGKMYRRSGKDVSKPRNYRSSCGSSGS